MITRWTTASVINAGDGWHQHPTQALLDCYTIRQQRGSLEGLRIAIVGDVKHSRVARSDVLAFTHALAKAHAEVTHRVLERIAQRIAAMPVATLAARPPAMAATAAGAADA